MYRRVPHCFPPLLCPGLPSCTLLGWRRVPGRLSSSWPNHSVEAYNLAHACNQSPSCSACLSQTHARSVVDFGYSGSPYWMLAQAVPAADTANCITRRTEDAFEANNRVLHTPPAMPVSLREGKPSRLIPRATTCLHTNGGGRAWIL